MQEVLEVEVGEWLRKRGLKLVAAESCTGGLIGHMITNVPGSSEYYLGSITAYAYEAKERLLGVRHETLSAYGAVSEQTVLEMARGARQSLAGAVALEQVIGVSVSGIAGPGGGTPDKPVGLTWIGLSAPGFERAWQYIWPGNRAENKSDTACQALRLVLEYLKGKLEVGYQKVEVSARWLRSGEILPEKVYGPANTYTIESTGRSWEDADGIHILCMVPGGQLLELLFKLNPAGWFMKISTGTGQMA